MQQSRESFRKMGLTFEEKAFYDILIALRDEFNFEYGEDKLIDGVLINEECRKLAKKLRILLIQNLHLLIGSIIKMLEIS